MINKYFFHKIFLLILLFFNPVCYGSNGQVFDGINYLNPANDLFVKKLRFTLGTVVYNPKIPFTGTVNGSPRKSTSNPWVLSPYSRLTYRIGSDIALGISINEPYRVVVKYELNKLGIPGLFDKESLRTVNMTPSVAVKILNNLWLGAGLNIIHYQSVINLVAPFDISPTPEIVKFNGNDISLSYVIGAICFLSPSTFLDVSLFSRNNAYLNGSGSFKGISGPNIASTRLVIPNTLIASLTHRFNQDLLLRLGIAHTYWKEFKNTRIDLPALTLPIPLDYKNTNRYALLLDYAISDPYEVGFFMIQDYTPTKLASSNFALAGDIFSVGIIASKKLTKSMKIRGLVGYAFNTDPVQIHEPLFNTFGQVKNRIFLSSMQIIYNLDA